MKNSVVRILSSIVGVAVMLAGLLVNKWGFGAMMLLIICTMLMEFMRMTIGKEHLCIRIAAIVTACVIFALVFCHEALGLDQRFIILSVVPLFVMMVMSLYVRDNVGFVKFACIYTALLYIVIPMTISNMLVFSNGEFNGTLLLSFLILTWSSDIGAYFFGTVWGQKYGARLFPSISPKKSWIGAGGGLFLTILTGMILYWTGMFTFPWYHVAALSVLMNVAAVYGDLFESKWKRACGIKDSGHLIPGHGGMLDRFDSILLAIPVGSIYLSIFNLI